jgi:phytoene dehydrogenase-like protein
VAVDAVVIGSGPNGLVAATLLARAGWSVELLERSDVAGGAVGSDTTERGYVHDWGSAFYGVLHASPVLRELGLDRRAAWAHTGTPVSRRVGRRRRGDAPDGRRALPTASARRSGVARPGRLVAPARRAAVRRDARPGGRPLPLLKAAARLHGPREGPADGADAARAGRGVGGAGVRTPTARMLFAANATHADVAVDAAGSTPPAMLLAMAAQVHGMPVPVGGRGRLAEAMVAVGAGGGRRRPDRRRGDAGGRARRPRGRRRHRGRHRRRCAPRGGRRRRPRHPRPRPGGGAAPAGAWLASLRRHRYTSGYFRVDVDLDRPRRGPTSGCATAWSCTSPATSTSWRCRRPRCGADRLPDAPAADPRAAGPGRPSRVPAGAASLWVECHCPARPRDEQDGWEGRFAERVLDRLEQHAPGLRETVVETTVTSPLGLQARDPNLVGGDVGGGSASPDQLLVFRPVAGWSSYRLPVAGLWMCGAASHPGGGVHGMCGRNAARSVLRTSRWGW